MKSITGRFCLVAAAIAASRLTAAEPEKMTWTFNGSERVAWVRSPSKEDPAGAPLIFVFHGLNPGDLIARNISRNWRLDQYWPEAYVVYMQGLPLPNRKDPDDHSRGWQEVPNSLGNRDLKFVDAVLADFKKDHHVDRKRVYAMGHSNGCLFTFLLWSERPGSFAAFALCSNWPDPVLKLRVPKPAFIVAGQTDTIVPLQNILPAIEAVRKLDGATGDGTSIEGGLTVYKSTKDAPVETLIHPGGHALPKEALKPIVDFFREHSLKR